MAFIFGFFCRSQFLDLPCPAQTYRAHKHRCFLQNTTTVLARLYGSPADSFELVYIASYAQSNNPQKVGRLCMRVLDRTKEVLDLMYTTT